MDPACVCAGGGVERRGDGLLHEGCSGAVLGGGLAQEDHCGTGEEREGGREAGEAVDIHEDAKCCLFFPHFISPW